MNTIEVKYKDVREGDTVEFRFDTGTTITGVAAASEDGHLYVPMTYDHTRTYLHSEYGKRAFVRAYREPPTLPTEPGSVIMDATINGESGLTAILDDDGSWHTTHGVGDECDYDHGPEDVTEWTLAKVVPA